MEISSFAQWRRNRSFRNQLKLRSCIWRTPAAIAISIALAIAIFAQSESASDASFRRAVSELGKYSEQIVRKGDEEAIVARYRAIIAAYPDNPEDLKLEMHIAQVLMDPRDSSKAYEVYRAAIDKYDPTNPYMKELLYSAGLMATDNDAQEAHEIFLRSLRQYPDDDVVRLQCYFGLGLNAEKQKQRTTAEEYYAAILDYDPTSLGLTETKGKIDTIRLNAANGLYWLASSANEPPEIQYAKIQAMLKKYPQIQMWNNDIVEERLNKLR